MPTGVNDLHVVSDPLLCWSNKIITVGLESTIYCVSRFALKCKIPNEHSNPVA